MRTLQMGDHQGVGDAGDSQYWGLPALLLPPAPLRSASLSRRLRSGGSLSGSTEELTASPFSATSTPPSSRG